MERKEGQQRKGAEDGWEEEKKKGRKGEKRGKEDEVEKRMVGKGI